MNKRCSALVMILAIVTVVLYSCKSKPDANQDGSQTTFCRVDADEFEKIIEDHHRVMLLDARAESEFKSGHIKDALQIDPNMGTFRKETYKLPTGKVIAVYCRTEHRSGAVAQILHEEGYDVVLLNGGYKAWVEAGKDVVK